MLGGMPVYSQWRKETATAILLGAVLFLSYFPYIISHNVRDHTYLKGDCFYYQATIVSILEDGDLFLNNNIGHYNPLNGDLALGRDKRVDRVVPKHPILMPVVSLPFYVLFGKVGLLILNVCWTIGVLVMLYLIQRLYFGRWISFSFSFLFGVATLFFNYSYNYSPDSFATFMVVSGLYFVLRRNYCTAALLLGLSVFAKVPNVVLVGVICLYAAMEILRPSSWKGEGPARPAKRVMCLAGFFVLLGIALLPMLLTNQALYGSPWLTGYHLEVNFNGIGDIDNHIYKFNQPFFAGLVRLLFHAEKGIVTTNPVLLLSVPGIFVALRRRDKRAFGLILALCIAQLAFFAKYNEWNRSHFSNRFLMTFVALSSVFAAAFGAAVAERLGYREAFKSTRARTVGQDAKGASGVHEA